MGNVRIKKAKRSGQREAGSFRVRIESEDLMTSGVVEGDELIETEHDIILIFRFRSKDRDESRAITDGNEYLSITTTGWRCE